MKWEIKYTSNWDEAEKLAAEGWELVGVSSQPDFLFWFLILASSYYYFKRPTGIISPK